MPLDQTRKRGKIRNKLFFWCFSIKLLDRNLDGNRTRIARLKFDETHYYRHSFFIIMESMGIEPNTGALQVLLATLEHDPPIVFILYPSFSICQAFF